MKKMLSQNVFNRDFNCSFDDKNVFIFLNKLFDFIKTDCPVKLLNSISSCFTEFNDQTSL